MSEFQQRLQAALRLHQQGQLPQAIDLYRELLTVQPNHLEALGNLASVLARSGQLEEALICYERALQFPALPPELWLNFANLQQRLANPTAAENALRRALPLQAAQVNLANLLRDQCRFTEAEEFYRQAIAQLPTHPLAFANLATMLVKQGAAPSAEPLLRQALALRPNQADWQNVLGFVLKEMGRHVEALACWKEAIRINPKHSEAQNNLGTLYRILRQPQLAVKHLQIAQRLDPTDPMIGANLAHSLLSIGQITKAHTCAEEVLQLHPDHTEGRFMRGFALTQQSRIEEALSDFLAAHQLSPSSIIPISNALFASLYSDQRSSLELLDLHRSLAAKIPPTAPTRTSWERDRTANRRLRVGFVSADLRRHPVAFFLEAFLRHHDRESLEILCYSTTAAPDEVSARLRAEVSLWRECPGWPDARLLPLVEADAPDILVDLSGHTADNRLGLFRAKPAPIQALYIGYPCSTGLPEMDWVIAEEGVCPQGHERFYSEKVARLDGSLWCYLPPQGIPPLGPPPALTRGFITFGSYNMLPKLSPSTIELWAEVLRAVPRSRLRLKALSFADPEIARQTSARFSDLGIDPARIETRPPTFELSKFLPEYGEMDIALDPIPYNGGTTTCEALWMGIPVITLPGDHFFSRMSSSFLHQAGLDGLIAQSTADYVRLATQLAADLPQLERWRRELRTQVENSPICDGPRTARALTQAFQQMWSDWLAQSVPSAFRPS